MDPCPLHAAMESIGGKWKLSIICSLSFQGALRYNELLKKIQGISGTMLAKSLKELERDGLITKQEFLEVPVRVEYALTDKAKSLQPILRSLAVWQVSN